ncbi:MAG TPA: hypothetical protein VK200_12990 [Candidatus Limnocylindrales bacterium]|nr:hypothetical protein [Candidatus Limnocylindrales bacterium]
MKEVKEFFENASPETTTRQSINVRRTLRRALLLGLLLLTLALRSALAAGPTGWGNGSCREITAFPANLVDPGVYCLSYKHIDFPLMSGVLIKISANNVVLDLNGATLDGTPKRNGAFSWGIQSYGRSNITVRNGTIRKSGSHRRTALI